MFELFEFLSLLVFSYLLIGFLIFGIANVLTRVRFLNAATRHNIWLSALLLLIALPLLSFVSIPSVSYFSNSDSDAVQFIEIPYAAPTFISNSETAVEATTQTNSGVGNVGITSVTNSSINKFLTLGLKIKSAIQEYVESGVNVLALMGMCFSVILVAGMFARIKGAIRSHNDFEYLVASSTSVQGSVLTGFESLADIVGLKSTPRLLSTDRLGSPIASGIASPVVIVPHYMASSEPSDSMLSQVLLHELAHIRRKDTFVVFIQMLSAIFLFWHPAFNLVNRRIKFEREIACDDWVLHFEKKNVDITAKSYANNLVQISELVVTQSQNIQTLSCVQPSNGLRARILILLNRTLNHSTSQNRSSVASAITVMSVALLLMSPVWPRYSLTLLDDDSSLEFSAPIAATANQAIQEPEPIHETSVADANILMANPEVVENDSTEGVKGIPALAATSQPEVVNVLAREPLAVDTPSLLLTSVKEPIRAIGLSRNTEGNIEESAPQTDPRSTSAAARSDMGLLLVHSDERATAQNSWERGAPNRLRLSINEEGELHIGAQTTIEEITVTAKRSLYSLRSQIRRAERNLFSTYNEYNLEEDFDVSCRRAELYESTSRAIRCWPKFFEDAVAEDAQTVLLSSLSGASILSSLSTGSYISYSVSTPVAVLRARNRHKFEMLKNNIVAVANAHPEVYESLTEIARLKTAYETKHSECMRKPAVLFVFRRCT